MCEKDNFYSDSTLVDMVLFENTSYYEEIVKRYKKLVFVIAKSIVSDYQLAEDISQDTFISAFMNLAKLSDKSKLSSWLCQITRHKAINYINRTKQEYMYENLETIPDGNNIPLEILIKKEEQEQILEAIDILSPKLKDVLILHYFSNYKVEKIANVLSIPIGTVKRRLYDARSILKKELSYMNNKELLRDGFEKNIMTQIQNLQQFRRNNQFNEFDAQFKKTLEKIDKMENSVKKDKFYSEIYLYKYWRSSNDNDRETALDIAKSCNYANVICSIYIGDIVGNYDKDTSITKLNKIIPEFEALKADNEKGICLFWIGFNYHNKGELEKALENFEKSYSIMNNEEVYKACAKASIKIVKMQLANKNKIVTIINSTCEKLEYRNDKLIFAFQPGYSLGNTFHSKNTNKLRRGAIFHYSSRCFNILYSENLQVGEIISDEINNATLTLKSMNDEINTNAGCFKDCMTIEVKSGSTEVTISYKRGIGIVDYWYKNNKLVTHFELQSFQINKESNKWLPLNIGNKWVYKEMTISDCYFQHFEYEVNWADEICANLSGVQYGYLDEKKDMDADTLVGIAYKYSNKWDFDNSIKYLDEAYEKADNNITNDFAKYAAIYHKKQKEYYHKGFRFLPSSINAENLTNKDGKIYNREACYYSLGPYRLGTRHAENKIFGTKVLRYLHMGEDFIWSDEYIDGYTKTKVDPINSLTIKIKVTKIPNSITVMAGEFTNVLKVNYSAYLDNLPKEEHAWGKYADIQYAGEKTFYVAKGVGVIKFDSVWPDGFYASCELCDYNITLSEEYFPLAVGNFWRYKEVTLEEGYIAEMSMNITSSIDEDYCLIREQNFVFMDTEEGYTDFVEKAKQNI